MKNELDSTEESIILCSIPSNIKLSRYRTADVNEAVNFPLNASTIISPAENRSFTTKEEAALAHLSSIILVHQVLLI